MTQPASGAKKGEDPVTKKAKTKKTPRTHATTRDAKPRHGATHAHAKSPVTTHPASHLTHAADPIVMAVIDSVGAIGGEPAQTEPAHDVKRDAPKARATNETDRPSLLARVVSLVVGVADALLPRKLVMRKHAH
jgi:hypothetical protein